MVIYLEKFFSSSGEQADQSLFLMGILWAEKADYSLYINIDEESRRDFKKNPATKKSLRKFDGIKENKHLIWYYERYHLLELNSENSKLVERLKTEFRYREIKVNSGKK